MTDLLQQGAAWLEDMRHKHASRPVTYRRGVASVALSATVGRSVFQVATTDGLVEMVERRDYLIRTTDLVLDGTPTTPAVGDRITEIVGGRVEVYAVMGAGSEKHFRPSDPDALTLRIHTAHVGTEV
jgi:hypothetical protein